MLDQLELDIVSEINQRDDQFNIAPTQRALVVSRGGKGYEAKAFRWGVVPSWAKDPKIGAKMINARSDSLVPKPKPSFRNAFAKRRCLVPASGYFEWKGVAEQAAVFYPRPRWPSADVRRSVGRLARLAGRGMDAHLYHHHR